MRNANALRIGAREASSVTLAWADGTSSCFHDIWLRDNCRCEACGTPETGRDEDGALRIRWSDGHESIFAADWLRAHAYDEAARRARGFRPRLWDHALRRDPPTMDFPEVDGDPAAFLNMLATVRDLGLRLLTGAPAEGGRLEPFARKIGPLRESNFGRVQDLVIDETKQSVANRAIALKPHTDEPYRASPPGILLFHCIETDPAGAGASTFMDGFELAEILRAEEPEGFAALARNRQPFRRHFADDVDLQAAFPVIALDAFGELAGIRINDRVAAPLAIPPEDVKVYYRGLKRLLELAEEPDRMLLRTLQPGDVAIFDNHRILHGRTELTMTGRRWLQWIQVNRGDFLSALRILPDRLGWKRGPDGHARGAHG